MRHTQRPPWGSGSTTPTGEGDGAHELSPGARADVPGGWPVVPREDFGQRRGGEGDEGGEGGRRTERVVDRGRRATGRSGR